MSTDDTIRGLRETVDAQAQRLAELSKLGTLAHKAKQYLIGEHARERAKRQDLQAELAEARAVIVDLRTCGPCALSPRSAQRPWTSPARCTSAPTRGSRRTRKNDAGSTGGEDSMATKKQTKKAAKSASKKTSKATKKPAPKPSAKPLDLSDEALDKLLRAVLRVVASDIERDLYDGDDPNVEDIEGIKEDARAVLRKHLGG